MRDIVVHSAQTFDSPETVAAEPVGVRHSGRVVAVAYTMVATFVLVLLHGMTPWSVGSLDAYYMAVGEVQCGTLSLSWLLRDTCVEVGGTAGAPFGNGLPMDLAAAVIARVTGVPVEWALFSTFVLMTATALVGAWALLRSLGVRHWVAAAGAFAYLLSPTLLGMHGFGTTFWGLALVPAALWATTRFFDLTWSRWSRAWLVAPWAALSYVLLFLDGYAYVMTQFSAGVLLLCRLASRSKWNWLLRTFVMFGAAQAVAYLAYRLTASSGGEFAKSSIDLFRSMGADVSTLVAPTAQIWWASATGTARDVSLLWGDGTNSRYNYLGLVAVVLAALGLYAAARRERRLLPWITVGVVAVLFALGPSLKIDAIRGPLVPPITYKSYLMPAAAATLTLPSQWLYQHIPGLDMMRATYRWMAIVRLVVVIFAAFGVEAALRRGRRWGVAVSLVAVLAVIELLPNIPDVLRSDAAHAAEVREVNSTVVQPLDSALPDWSRVVIAPNASGENDYLAQYIASGAHVLTYNVGGDKSLAPAEAAWPEAVTDLILDDPSDYAGAVFSVLDSGDADAVVAPYFDLRWSIGQFPGPEMYTDPGREAAADALSDVRLSVQDFGQFAIITLAKN